MGEDPLDLRVEGLTITNRDHELLSGISFELPEGKLMAVLGPSGAGKSTLLKALVGENPYTGTLSISGAQAREGTPGLKALLGYVPQDLQLYTEMTVEENILFFGSQYGIGRETLLERARELTRAFELSDKLREKVKTLSGGQQRRVSIAAAMVHRPRLLVLDEPTSGLDPAIRKALWRFLKQVNAQFRMSLLVTTHFIDETEYCDSVLLIHQGKQLHFDTPQNLKLSLPGQGRAVEVEFHGLTEAMMSQLKAAEQRLYEAGAIERMDASGFRVRFYAQEPQQATPFIVQTLGETGLVFKSVNIVDVTMEDVFFYYTGQRFPKTDRRNTSPGLES